MKSTYHSQLRQSVLRSVWNRWDDQQNLQRWGLENRIEFLENQTHSQENTMTVGMKIFKKALLFAQQQYFSHMTFDMNLILVPIIK